MKLPLKPPIKPQLALTRKELPEGEEWAYEPKLDGFRAIVFVDGDESTSSRARRQAPVAATSRSSAFPPGRYVLDGELVIRDDDGEPTFDALQKRHPSGREPDQPARRGDPGRLRRLRPARRGGRRACSRRRFGERRERLEPLAERAGGIEPTPLTTDAEQARLWLRTIEGVIAKQLDAPYRPGKRKGMAKVKRERTIDCVVMGWRPGQGGGHGRLADPRPLRRRRAAPGRATSPGSRRRPSATCATMLRPLETGDRGSGEPSRWTGGRDLEWVELRPELVIEVGYDHASAGRIRHGTRFLRFRDDKEPRECRFEDLDEGG